jgi:hypothetical protein
MRRHSQFMRRIFAEFISAHKDFILCDKAFAAMCREYLEVR